MDRAMNVNIIVTASLLLKVPAIGSMDPCLYDNHQEFPDQMLGSRNEICSSSHSSIICDYYLEEKWFVSSRGIILNHCPSVGNCGVPYPAWINGTYPDIDSGIVEWKVCIKNGENCCADAVTVSIKNCTDYLVYYLEPLPYCQTAYCFNSGLNCDGSEKTTPDGNTKSFTSIQPTDGSSSLTNQTTTQMSSTSEKRDSDVDSEIKDSVVYSDCKNQRILWTGIAIGAGSVVVLTATSFGLVWIFRKKSKKSSQDGRTSESEPYESIRIDGARAEQTDPTYNQLSI